MSYIITGTKLKNIADAVRDKCGGSLMNLSSMINKIGRLKPGDGVVNVSQYSGNDALWNAIRIATFDPTLVRTSTMTSMNRMFAAWPFTTLDFQGFDTSNVTDMSEMFYVTQSVTSLTNLTYLDTSKVTIMKRMFAACYKLKAIDLSGWDTSNVTDMSELFNGMGSQAYQISWGAAIDLSGWDTSNVTNMNSMFRGLYNGGGKIWVPSTFVATAVSSSSDKPFYYAPNSSSATPFGYWKIYTDATDAQTQGWGTIHSNFIVYYNSTYQDFINA